MTLGIAWAIALLGAACAPLDHPRPPARVAIIVAERGPAGARLVAIDETGDRQFDLISEPTAMTRDTNPTVSPDGQWIVFVSSRERTLDETSLWIARVGVESVPHRLTRGPWIDAHPTWTPDGKAIVFASTRAKGNFDLWRIAMVDGVAGTPEQLTNAPGHEITPSVARDGAIIYAEATPDLSTGDVESHLEERRPDGAIHHLTDGPADVSPAVSPDGRIVLFSRPRVHLGIPNGELWRLARGPNTIAPLIELPLTDESGPVWSRDGRFVFATSVLRGSDGKPLFSSVVHIDTREPTLHARMLEDRVGEIVRLTPAITATPLDAAVLRRDPEYLPELAKIMERAIERQEAGKS